VNQRGRQNGKSWWTPQTWKGRPRKDLFREGPAARDARVWKWSRRPRKRASSFMFTRPGGRDGTERGATTTKRRAAARRPAARGRSGGTKTAFILDMPTARPTANTVRLAFCEARSRSLGQHQTRLCETRSGARMLSIGSHPEGAAHQTDVVALMKPCATDAAAPLSAPSHSDGRRGNGRKQHERQIHVTIVPPSFISASLA